MKHRRGKRKFAGKNMHLEFHTVNPKKSKAADCIYLTEDRNCQNKKSPNYLAKCFAASYCTYRIKAKDAQSVKPGRLLSSEPAHREAVIQKISCSLPPQCNVYSPAFGQGNYTGYHAEKRIIEVTFGDVAKKFIYPDAFLNKHLILPKFAFQIVLRDISKAKKG